MPKSLLSNHSQHAAKRPMILPTQIDLVTPASVANIGGEAPAAVRGFGSCSRVNHVSAVNYHFTGIVIGDGWRVLGRSN